MRIKEAFFSKVFSPFQFSIIAGLYLFISLLETFLFGSSTAWKTVMDFILLMLIGTFINMKDNKNNKKK